MMAVLSSPTQAESFNLSSGYRMPPKFQNDLGNSMRIAQVAPLYESVPPKYYGGTERVVSYLTEELVQQGHDVTLFASGDSVTKARLVAACRRSLRLDKHCIDHLAHHTEIGSAHGCTTL